MPPERVRKKRSGAFSLMEAALIISLSGLVLAAFIPTFLRELRTSKVSEASEELQNLYDLTAAYYAAPHFRSGKTYHCLPPQAGPTPQSPSAQARFVQFAFPHDPATETWRALGFQPRGQIRFRYIFAPQRSGCWTASDGPRAPIRVMFRAEGDLDGDGQFSTFERRASASRNGALEAEGILDVIDRVE